MSDGLLFCIIFFGIILSAIIISWIVVHGPRVVVHEHRHLYKMSKDYGRLWDLVVVEGRDIIGIDDSSVVFRYNHIFRGDENIYGLNDKFNFKKKTKEQFIAYCQYLNFEFLDPADEVK